MNERETVASLRILVAVARANGRVTDAERQALSEELREHAPPGITMEALLGETVDLDAELQALCSNEARGHTYALASALVDLHGDASEAEQALLEKLRAAFGLPPENRSFLRRLLQGAREVEGWSEVAPIADPIEREEAISRHTHRVAVANAVAGALPLPGVDLGLMIYHDAKLIHDIARYNGQKLTRAKAWELALGLTFVGVFKGGIMSALKLVAPVAMNALCAVTWYGTTYGIKSGADYYLRNANDLDPEQMRKAFDQGKHEAETFFRKHSTELLADRANVESALRAAAQALQAGDITAAEFDAKLSKAIH